ncbi:CHAP domain-containing protein [Streptomyces asiaticus]|uniref:CHAP domain-containing protein n=1 Tax=Streptomyces asiaticus TaxID=114695 RepID=UPI003F677148
MQVEKILALAESQVGVHEGRSNGHWNNNQRYSDEVPGLEWSDYQAWCCTFVSWLAYKAGASGLFPRTASCLTAVSWFKQRGRWSEYPAIGAQIFFGTGGGSHTGIVYDYDSTYAYTIEGNTNLDGSAEGDGVYKKRRVRRDAYVYGYGLPKYKEGIKSADPRFAKDAPKAPTSKPSKPSTPPAKPGRPVVSVAHLNAARAKDVPAPTGHVTHKAEVLVVENALVAEGFLAKRYADGSWGTMTDKAYERFRREVMHLTGRDATGSVGLSSLKVLASRRGFTAKA